MAAIKIPLILPATARGWATSIGTSAKDQQLINGVYVASQNKFVGSRSVYVQKRGGSTDGSTIGTGVVVLKCYSDRFGVMTATSTAVFESGTNLGTLDAAIDSLGSYILADSVVGDVTYLAFVTEGGTGWYYASDGTDDTFPTFVGDRTSGSAVISNIASTNGIYSGQAVSGTGIPANTRVLTVDSATQITLTANATSGSGTATTITREAIAKILDTDFPDAAHSIVAMDGYFFADSEDEGIGQSNINDPSSWNSANRVTPDFAGDTAYFLFTSGNYVVCAGRQYSIQYFYNAGNASGSVLSKSENLSIRGLQLASSPIQFGGEMYCIAQRASSTLGGTGPIGLYRLSGVNSFQRVSDDFWSSVIADGGFRSLGTIETTNKALITVGSAATFPVYDPETGEFTLFSLASAITSSFGPRFTRSGETKFFSWAGGNTWTDSSAAYTLTAQTEPKFLNDGRPFIIRHVDLIADIEASGSATLYVSRDDGASWVSVGTFDMAAQRKRIHALGWFQSSVAFKVEHSSDTNFRAQALIVDIERCGG